MSFQIMKENGLQLMNLMDKVDGQVDNRCPVVFLYSLIINLH